MSSISRRNPFAMPEPRAAPRNPFEPAAPPAASAAPTAAPAAGKAANSSSSSSLADDPFGLAQQRAHSAAAPVTAAAQAPRPLATQPAAVRPASVTSLPIARPNVVSSAMAAPQPPPTALPATHAQTQIQYASRPQQSKPAIQPEAIAPQPPALGIPPQPPKHSSFTPAVRPKDDDDDDLFGDGDGIAKARSGPAQEISLSDAHATEHLEDNFFDDDDGDGLVIEPATPLSPLQPLSAVRGVRFQPRAAATSSSGASKPATMSAAALRQRMRQAAEWEDIRDVPRLHELLSDMASERDELRRKLQEQQLELASRVVSPRQAVVALLLGQPTSLEHFQSLEQKLALLDTAVAMHAGSALTKIVVFLSRTLSSHVLHRHLASRSQAAKHLYKHLLLRGEHEKIFQTAVGTGMHATADAASLKLALHEKDAMLRQAAVNKALRDIEVRQRPAEDLREYAELLQLQMAIEVNDVVAAQSGTNPHMVALPRKAELPLSSAVVTVYYCTLYHYADTEDKPGSLSVVQKFLQLPDKQYYATVISALALKKQWAEIERLCTVKSVFASSKLQPRISAKLLVLLLIAAHAPPDVMSKYLKLLTDSEEKFRLAHSCGCYTVAIDALIELRDRERIRAYANRPEICHDSALVVRIRSAEGNSGIKWYSK